MVSMKKKNQIGIHKKKKIWWYKGWFVVGFRHTLQRVCSEWAVMKTNTKKLKLYMNWMNENWMKDYWLKNNGIKKNGIKK